MAKESVVENECNLKISGDPKTNGLAQKELEEEKDDFRRHIAEWIG